MERILIKDTIKNIGKEVKILGWVFNRRDHGKIIFIDLLDRSGIIQLVFTPSTPDYQEAENLRSNWVISTKGKIVERPKNMINEKIETGKIEMEIKQLEIINKSETLPITIDTSGYEIGEEIRLKYRYLDLKRERLQKNILKRHKIIQFIRNYLTSDDFIEIETPILTKSTPEGARDFLTPSRLEPGKFYALPQSPQQYKQLLMVAGFEKYFQIAKCFRDEDTRGDRQPEFTQLDIEMSFIKSSSILEMIEKMMLELVKNNFPEKKISKIPFPRITYKEALKIYQSDRPDMRNDKNNFDELAFAFVIDFPMFEWRESEKRWDAVHHPFTKPQVADVNAFRKTFKENPDLILADQYDLVLNGHEIGGGSIRIHDPELLSAVFEAMDNKKEEIKEKFGHLFEAFNYGAPPHGGMAIGLDRLIMILLNEPNIREIIAFPKAGDGRDLMINAPSEIDEKQLQELKIKRLVN